ncbi:MAG: hypothetical protein E7291_09790 [Lachnospiraceae bacterium]|nr:hypothetical protein [Lachnospiraceae bacterium]
MIFTMERNQLIIEKQDRRERQCAQVSELCKQRLLGYAESFHELARSLDGSFAPVAEDRQGVLEAWKSWENRQVISTNLKEVAQIMTQVAMEELWYQPLEDRKRRLLHHALRTEGIYAENICYLPNEKGRKAIGMTLFTDKKGGIPATEISDMLSVILKQQFQTSVTSPYLVDQNRRSFVFVEEARYIALTGFSKAVKESETISGDNYSVIESEKGKMTILLSDGTGSGEQANADSGKVLDLMEKMLEAGFSTEAAVNMVNAAMFATGEEYNHPTLDICTLDLYQGHCDICKVGGAATFIKREQQVEEISGGTLPLGIFQNVQVQTLHRQLEDGDYLIFMTDGVLDALEGNDCEALMQEAIRGINERNPQEIAERLIQQVLCHCGGRILDDMTILVVGIWEN